MRNVGSLREPGAQASDVAMIRRRLSFAFSASSSIEVDKGHCLRRCAATPAEGAPAVTVSAQ